MARTANGFIYLGLGAALMYLMDPQQGRKRRNDLLNQVDSTRRKVQRGTDMALRDATNRTHGVLVQTQQWLRSQRERLESRASNEPSISPGTGPAIGAAKNAAAPWMRERWSPAQRALAGMLGAGLATSGYVRGGLGGLLMTMAGVGLVARASANEPLGTLARGKGFSVDRTLRVDASPEEVFAYWRDLEHFPRWMSHVREVRPLGGDRYHWSVDGPAGVPVEWDSELTGVRENRELAWRTVEGSTVDHRGRVRFSPEDDGTRVHVELHYAPPGGVIGQAVAKAFGVDPASEIDDDLANLRRQIESARGRGTTLPRASGSQGMGAAPA
ncbi:MAG TPA: SRPBCC family protein [Usitatibacter sp.]|jgi:uncharacterized membrane protein|nr:SRPBCC family protein [Usitatibacter sp.]